MYLYLLSTDPRLEVGEGFQREFITPSHPTPFCSHCLIWSPQRDNTFAGKPFEIIFVLYSYLNLVGTSLFLPFSPPPTLIVSFFDEVEPPFLPLSLSLVSFIHSLISIFFDLISTPSLSLSVSFRLSLYLPLHLENTTT